MRACGPSSRVGTGVGALIALLAIGLLAPAPARGDCSHRADRPTFGLDRATLAAWGDPAPLVRPLDPIPAPKPCAGPQCSGKSAPAPATVAPPVPPTPEWAFVPRVAADRPPACAFAPDAFPPLLPGGLPPAIFHPPRRPR